MITRASVCKNCAIAQKCQHRRILNVLIGYIKVLNIFRTIKYLPNITCENKEEDQNDANQIYYKDEDAYQT